MADEMMGVVVPSDAATTHGITAAERQRRFEAVASARASVALERFQPTPADIEHERRFIEGEIDLAAYVATPLACGR